MLDRHDLGVLRRRGSCDRYQGLSGGVGDQMKVKISGCKCHWID
jgi:hypothetical protein